MTTKLYSYSVPVTIYAIKRVDILAESEAEALESLRATDWYDSKDDTEDEECDFDKATLDDVQEWGDEE